jgi:uncharacterized protein
MTAADVTPRPTKLALVTTLAATTGLAAFVLAGGAGTPRSVGAVLAVLTGMFLVRVVGQVAVLLRAPGWLPPMRQWNLLPYRFLLPIQVAFLAVMAWLVASLVADDGAPASRSPEFGASLLAASAVYAASMAVRYAVRMHRRPDERWFGGTIPIVFHVVLASYLFVFGSFHAS